MWRHGIQSWTKQPSTDRVMLVMYYILRVGVDDAGCFAALVAELEAELEDEKALL